jgi:hypothetical protein
LTTVSASLRLRPTRIGFLVDPNDGDSVRRIFQICTCLWGGVFNPIIPVCTETPAVWRDHPFPDQPTAPDLARGYVDFFEPDVFVEAQSGLADRIGIKPIELGFLSSRVKPLTCYFEVGKGGRRSEVPFGLSIFPVYKALYEREFKFVPRHEHRVARLQATPADAAFVEAAFGGFPTTGPLAPISQAYTDAFAPAELPATAEN